MAGLVAHTVREVSTESGELEVQVRVELVPVKSSSGALLGDASLFSYVHECRDPSDRPLLVVFNGGPGSASAWLHLSGLATHRAVVPEPGGEVPTETLVPSEFSVLDTADLLFIDPVGTGFGRAAAEADHSELWATEAEAEYFAKLVRGWLARYRDSRTPIVIMGESFGTVRAPLLARKLSEDMPALRVAGVVLLGQSLNLQDTLDRPTNAVSSVASLPLIAAAAAYHGHLEAENLGELVDRAYAFALEKVVPARLRGTNLSDSELGQIASGLEELTAIAANEWSSRCLRLTVDSVLSGDRFGDGRALGRYDVRYTLKTTDPLRGEMPVDPSLAVIFPAYSVAMQEFLGRVLLPDGVWGSAGEDPRAECPQGERREYRFFERSALKPWNWHVSGSTYSHMPGDHPSAFNVFDHARTLNLFMLANPRALVLIGTGIFDSMTTVGGAELMVGTLTAPERVRHRRYEAGHMMYTDRNSAEQLAQDVKQLLHEASARNTEAN